MLIERADFADLDSLAAHRQTSWERQRDYVAACSKLHRCARAGAAPPLRLEALAGRCHGNGLVTVDATR